MWKLLALILFHLFMLLYYAESHQTKKKKNGGGGDIGKAVQGKKGLESPGYFFPSEKNIRELGRNCGPLRKKEKPTYLVLSLKP